MDVHDKDKLAQLVLETFVFDLTKLRCYIIRWLVASSILKRIDKVFKYSDTLATH